MIFIFHKKAIQNENNSHKEIMINPTLPPVDIALIIRQNRIVLYDSTVSKRIDPSIYRCIGTFFHENNSRYSRIVDIRYVSRFQELFDFFARFIRRIGIECFTYFDIVRTDNIRSSEESSDGIGNRQTVCPATC